VGHGIEQGKCNNCGQIVEYDQFRKTRRVIKIGRVSGDPIIPHSETPVPSAEKELPVREVSKGGAGNTITVDIPRMGKDMTFTEIIPQEPIKQEVKRAKWVKHPIQFFHDNKEAMIEDYQTMKVVAFFKKWHIATTTWAKLKRGWGVTGKGHRGGWTAISNRKANTEAMQQVLDEPIPEIVKPRFPLFPSWNESWSDTVKLAWFRTYQELSANGH